MTRIFLENADNSLTGIYVHYDEDTQEILKKNYSKKEEIETLLKKGPILSLTKQFSLEDNGVFFQDRFRNAEESRNPKIEKSFLFSSGTWMLSENGSCYYPI